MKPYKITEIIDSQIENENIKTIYFDYACDIIPGQFFMIWIVGVDEIPMSVSYINKKLKGFTFRRVGEATNSLFKLKKGDKIGVRGPYGNGFNIEGTSILFVGGGTGVAMLAPAVEQALKKNISSTMIIGAKCKEEIFFRKRFEKCGCNLFITTDDGSYGKKGTAVDVANNLLKNENFDLVLTCGPEIMMKKLQKISKKINFQASLERYMKCSVGICGQCCIGQGLRVCVEGPIFNGEILNKIDDFGKFKRDQSGKRINI
jgi:dihydroorotate dehydrogenase electron transfer subunit